MQTEAISQAITDIDVLERMESGNRFNQTEFEVFKLFILIQSTVWALIFCVDEFWILLLYDLSAAGRASTEIPVLGKFRREIRGHCVSV